MSKMIRLEFDDVIGGQLREIAQEAGITAEEFAYAVIVQALDMRRDEAFDDVLRKILTKNRELYERLAK